MPRPRKWNKDLIIKRIKNLEKELKRRPVKRDNNSLYRLTRLYFGTWNNAMKSAGFEVKELQSPIVPAKLTPLLSYFIGLMITDGHIQSRTDNYGEYKVNLYTSYEDEIKSIISLIKNLFNYEASVYARKCGWNIRLNYEVYISSKKIVELLNKKYEIPIGNKSLIVRVPQIFFKADMTNVSNFLRGVIDGDGSIKGRAGNMMVTIASGSIGFLNDIKLLLNRLDISSGKILFDKKSKCKYFSITKISNLVKLYNLIYNYTSRFYYKRKRLTFKNNIFKYLNE